MEIRRYQKTTDLLLRKLPFVRLVSGLIYRFSLKAAECVQIHVAFSILLFRVLKYYDVFQNSSLIV